MWSVFLPICCFDASRTSFTAVASLFFFSNLCSALFRLTRPPLPCIVFILSYPVQYYITPPVDADLGRHVASSYTKTNSPMYSQVELFNDQVQQMLSPSRLPSHVASPVCFGHLCYISATSSMTAFSPHVAIFFVLRIFLYVLGQVTAGGR